MIAIPRLNQLPFDTIILGGSGHLFARLYGMNEHLSTVVLMVAAIANQILFHIADLLIRPRLNISSEAIYTVTNAIVTTSTILAAQQLSLISRRWASLLMFGSLLLLTTRVKYLNSTL